MHPEEQQNGEQPQRSPGTPDQNGPDLLPSNGKHSQPIEHNWRHIFTSPDSDISGEYVVLENQSDRTTIVILFASFPEHGGDVDHHDLNLKSKSCQRKYRFALWNAFTI